MIENDKIDNTNSFIIMDSKKYPERILKFLQNSHPDIHEKIKTVTELSISFHNSDKIDVFFNFRQSKKENYTLNLFISDDSLKKIEKQQKKSINISKN